MKTVISVFYLLFVFCVFTSCTLMKRIGNKSTGSFSGEIHYKISYISKNDSANIDSLANRPVGQGYIYLVNGKQYKVNFIKNGEVTYSYTYGKHDKYMYDYYKDRPYLTYRDSRKKTTESDIKKTVFKDSTVSLLGYKAYKIVTEFEKEITNSYYSDDLRIPYKAYKNHNVGSWNERLKITKGGILLRSESHVDDYIQITEATKIVKRDIQDSEFDLPNLPIASSFEMVDKIPEPLEMNDHQHQCFQQKMLLVPDLMKGNHPYFFYFKFLVMKDGEIKFPKPSKYFESIPPETGLIPDSILTENKDLIFQIGVDFLTNCNLKFSPGEINSEPVITEILFPIPFQL